MTSWLRKTSCTILPRGSSCPGLPYVYCHWISEWIWLDGAMSAARVVVPLHIHILHYLNNFEWILIIYKHFMNYSYIKVTSIFMRKLFIETAFSACFYRVRKCSPTSLHVHFLLSPFFDAFFAHEVTSRRKQLQFWREKK